MDYDVIVVGAGHAGVEAAIASAKMGMKVALYTLSFDAIALLSCNPSIGGSAKGIVVREIDALGGIMAKAADYEYLQLKMLNTSKGPGVQCLRSQSDRDIYPKRVKYFLNKTKNLDVIEGMIIDLIYDQNKVYGVVLEGGQKVYSKAVILTTGTFMEAEILRGDTKYKSGPDGLKASLGLSKSLQEMGLDIYRLKTGTPPRVDKRTIDFSKTKIQYGAKEQLAFSYTTNTYVPFEEQLPCHLIYTSVETHRIINENMHRSAQFSGLMEGIGPRYCPSIEAKIHTFIDKPRHQLFLEPETRDGNSIYIQGFASSMPIDVQEKMVHSLPGLENAKILKFGYAIEYDALTPTQFDLTMRVKKYEGLYGAGQICGTSGYEEAAGLGLVAGINATRAILGKDPFILKRNESYIGVMIDDLVTKGAEEPYRLLSSRAEYRLLLRHDNADLRLLPYGYDLGLISEERYQEFLDKNKKIEEAKNILSKTYLGANDKINNYLLKNNISPLKAGHRALDFLKRPNVKMYHLIHLINDLKKLNLSELAISQIEISVKYEGYIAKQEKEAQGFMKFEAINLPKDINYLEIHGLALEARQQLQKIRPQTIGQASRVSGVNPSDIAVLILTLKKEGIL